MRLARSAAQDLRARPLRTLLTALSMLVGVLAVVGVSAADQLSTGYVVAAHEQLRGRGATFAVSTSLAAGDAPAAEQWLAGVRARIGPQDAAALLAVHTSVHAQAPHGAGADLQAQWLSGDLSDVYRRPVAAGAWTDAGVSAAPAVVLNESGYRRLGLTGLPATVSLHDGSGGTRAAVVTGVVADALEEPVVYGHLADAARVWPDSVGSGTTSLLLTAAPGAQGVATDVLLDAAAVAGVTVTDPEVRRVDTTEEARASADVVRRAFSVCAVTALVVAGIGVLNIGLASLTERSRELVVRRAVGARRVDVFGQVVGSHLLLALAVAAVAVAAVLVGVYLVAPAMTPHTFVADPVTVPWAAVLNGTVAALGTSLAGAAAPAVAATRLPVADALRA